MYIRRMDKNIGIFKGFIEYRIHLIMVDGKSVIYSNESFSGIKTKKNYLRKLIWRRHQDFSRLITRLRN